ncbi:glutamate--glyoxylate aminotransferase 1-like [Euphorbia lathyris]|uniref:glutamate--glyoxylate aminotransferase 1-like n=1 Tax=Euphorbia lathyris TaxID=212925 RepID=UPI0033143543
MDPKPLDYESLNENVKKVQYAVRGEFYLRASELQKEGKKIIFTNVGNPHALGQKPLTFPRQVIALCQAPFLLDDPNVGLMFPADAIAKAKHYLSLTSGGLDILTMEDDDIIKRESSQPIETNSKKRKRA